MHRTVFFFAESLRWTCKYTKIRLRHPKKKSNFACELLLGLQHQQIHYQTQPNMNTIDCIKTRRSVRKFKNEQIKDEELFQVLEAGTWSPTSHPPSSSYSQTGAMVMRYMTAASCFRQ